MFELAVPNLYLIFSGYGGGGGGGKDQSCSE